MLKHIVMFTLKDYAEFASKEENAKKLKAILERMPARILEIKSYEVGINISELTNSADAVLVSSFEDKSALEAYKRHPDHIEAGDFINKIIISAKVVDYEDV